MMHMKAIPLLAFIVIRMLCRYDGGPVTANQSNGRKR